MIDLQRVRRLATPRPRAYAGFGVTHNGRLIVHTVNTSPERAKLAAIGSFRTNGVRWSHLRADGYQLVTVSINVLDTVA